MHASTSVQLKEENEKMWRMEVASMASTGARLQIRSEAGQHLLLTGLFLFSTRVN